MTDVLFITISNEPTLKQEVNGSLILATKLLQDNFSVKVLRFCEFESWKHDYPEFIRQITARILEISPKCISFYTLCATYHIVLRIAKEVRAKNPGIRIVFGGPQASVTAYDTINSMGFIDYVCTGEGENTVVPFFRAILRDNGTGVDAVPGLFYRLGDKIVSNNKNSLPTDLESLPYWNDQLLLPNEGSHEPNISSSYYYMPIDAGRGCPFNCTFCSTSLFWERKYRLKSAERIIADIQYFSSKFGINSFDVAHDAFTANAKLVTEVCDCIKANGLKISWKCTTRIDCISKELILKMKDAGLTWISLGIESGSSRIQKQIKKRLDLSTIKPMVEFLLAQKINVTLFFMYGFPEETEEDLNETLELMFSLLDMGVHRVSMSFCLFDPATEITVKNYEKLFFNPDIGIISRNIFGYKEEMSMIESNKALFSFFYHLNTPVRNNYQYLHFLAKLYEADPIILSQVRKGYQGDNLRFYRDFYVANESLLRDIDRASSILSDNPWEMISCLLEQINYPNYAQAKAICEFKRDVSSLMHAADDAVIRKCYDFNYNEYRARLPLDVFSCATSELLIIKEKQKLSVRLLRISM